MAAPSPLGEFEQLVLLAVLQAGQAGEAYGITVFDVLGSPGTELEFAL